MCVAFAAIGGCGGEPRSPMLAGGREVKSWVEALRDPNPQVRRRAVLKLGNVGDADPAVPAALAEALKDSDALVRRDAIPAVVKLSNPGEAIVTQLQAMSQDDGDARVRELAGKALAKLNRAG